MNANFRQTLPVLISVILFVLALICFACWVKWTGIPISFQVTQLAGLMSPLILASAFIERAVEILVSPWRDTGASKLEKRVAAIKTSIVDAVTAQQKASELGEASDRLDDYRGQTQRYAFAVSLAMSTCAAIVGVRGFWPFVDHTAFTTLGHAQQVAFSTLDVGLSAALLAGGADGLHSIVNAVTSFFDATADKATQQGASPGTAGTA